MAGYKILGLILMISNCFANATYANEPSKKFYITLNIGRAFPLKFKVNEYPAEKKPEPSTLQSIGIGHKVNNNLRLDISATRFNSFSYHTADEVYNSRLRSNRVWDYRQKISSTLFAANIYYDIMNYRNFIPFATIGIGASRNSSQHFTGRYYSKNNDNDNKNRTKYYLDSDKKTVTQFAWVIGAGLAYKVNNTIHLDLITYKYHDLGKAKSMVCDSYGEAPTLKTSLKTHSISTGVRIGF